MFLNIYSSNKFCNEKIFTSFRKLSITYSLYGLTCHCNCTWLWSVGHWSYSSTWMDSWLPDDQYVPDLVQMTVVAPQGRSDQSSLSVSISMTQAAAIACVLPGPYWQTVVFVYHEQLCLSITEVCYASVCLSWSMLISQSRPHYKSVNLTSDC